MNHNQNSRRQFIKNTGAGLGLLSLPSLLYAHPDKTTIRKVVCIGGHPDDPESGCGGTLARLAKNGNAVTIIYLTTGEAGIQNKSHNEASFIRKQEAISACKILNATPLFAGQIDGATIVNNEWISRLQKMIEDERPDIVFTHWPVDSHKDHQAASLLTMQAWLSSKNKWPNNDVSPNRLCRYNRNAGAKKESCVLSYKPDSSKPL